MNKELTINGQPFDFSEAQGAYVHKVNETLTLVWDGANVIPLQVYEMNRNHTVYPDGSVSRTDTVRFVQPKEVYEQKMYELKGQAVDTAKGLLSIVYFCTALLLLYCFWQIIVGIGSTAPIWAAGLAEAINELLYYCTWIFGAVLFLFALWHTVAYLIKAKFSNPSAEIYEAEKKTDATGAGTGPHQININVNQGGTGYNAAQGYANGSHNNK